VSTHELLLPVLSDLDGTEVFRAVRTSGAVVQVPYSVLAPGVSPPVSGLTALTGAGTADGDLFQIYDVSATANKKQTAAELAIAVSSRLTNTTCTGTLHATGATTLDSTLAAAGTTVTTLHATGAATLDSTLAAAGTTVTTLHATGAATLDSTLAAGATSITGLLDVTNDKVRVRTAKTPASAAAAGNAGDICWDADYLYVCVASSTWKRVAIATW
jgi:hypothetical protein